MFNIPRRVVCSQSLTKLFEVCRSYSSYKKYRDLEIALVIADELIKKERERCTKFKFCFDPFETLAPFPGRVGIPPLSMLFPESHLPIPGIRNTSPCFGLIDARAPFPGNVGIAPIYIPKPSLSPREYITFLKESMAWNKRMHQNIWKRLIIPPTDVLKVLSSLDMVECYTFECSQQLKTEFADIFPLRDLNQDELTVIIFCLKDTVRWDEKDDVVKCVEKFSEAACKKFERSKYWADFVHPTATLEFIRNFINYTYTMVEDDERYNYGFTIEDLWCSSVISKLRGKKHTFFSAVFTNAPAKGTAVETIKFLRNFINYTYTMVEDDERYNYGFTIEALGCSSVISKLRGKKHTFFSAVFTNAPVKGKAVETIKDLFNKI